MIRPSAEKTDTARCCR